MAKKTAVPNNGNKEFAKAVIVSETKSEKMYLQEKKEGLRKLDAEEKKSIDKAKKKKITYEKITKFICKHINIVMDVAEHLHIIRYYKLYRLHYNTFEEYVEENFNYTRSRAYQLTRAHVIAEFINNRIGSKVLTTEPQCRELLRLRIYKDDDDEDEQQTQEAQLALVGKIWKAHQKVVKASLIAEEVDKEMNAFHEKRVQSKSVEKYSADIKSTVGRFQKNIIDVLSSKTLSAEELNNIKIIAREELKKIFESLK